MRLTVRTPRGPGALGHPASRSAVFPPHDVVDQHHDETGNHRPDTHHNQRPRDQGIGHQRPGHGDVLRRWKSPVAHDQNTHVLRDGERDTDLALIRVFLEPQVRARRIWQRQVLASTRQHNKAIGQWIKEQLGVTSRRKPRHHINSAPVGNKNPLRGDDCGTIAARDPSAHPALDRECYAAGVGG